MKTPKILQNQRTFSWPLGLSCVSIICNDDIFFSCIWSILPSRICKSRNCYRQSAKENQVPYSIRHISKLTDLVSYRTFIRYSNERYRDICNNINPGDPPFESQKYKTFPFMSITINTQCAFLRFTGMITFDLVN